MQAIILAAGMGKRLKELTSDNTKCMIKVNGVTLIERMLAQLDRLGLSRIVLVVGYKAGTLKNFLNTLEVKTPIEYVENPDYYKTNNIYSLYLAREYLYSQDTLLLESDLIFDDSVLQALTEDTYPSLALVAKYESWMDGTVVTLRPDCRINNFLDKAHFQFADIRNYFKTVNIYKFSRHFSESQYVPFLEAYCHALGNNEYYEQVLKVIVMLDKSELKAKVLEQGSWYEIDDIQDLDIAESIFTRSASEKLDRIQKRYGGYWRYPKMLDFCYLVNPFFPPQKLMDEIKANSDIIAAQYPSGHYVNDLLAAKFFGVTPSLIVTGNGAAELVRSLLNQITGKIGIIRPTFEEYPNRKAGDAVVFIPKNDAFSYSADDLIDFFGSKSIDALVVINPDNPSGNYLPHESIMKLIKWAEVKSIRLILDESFVDFANLNDTLLVDEFLIKYPHLVVIKSISKSYGVSGLRLGVLVCSDEHIVSVVRNDLPTRNINSFAEFFLQIYEKYKDEYVNAMRRFDSIRRDFMDALEKIKNLRVLPSQANFIMCETLSGITAVELTETLLDKYNILIKNLSGKNGIDGQFIRMAVKTPEENQTLIKALVSVFAAEPNTRG
jgi:histidinol-phosphate/aromatic aminotransferase/cobyric acid decarboxylase-like protein/choline kinase